jgi:predicted alpha/beta superfamily hydrolase
MTNPASKSLRLTLALLIVGAPVLAQDSTARPWTRHTIQSTKLNEQRQVFVALPDGYRAETRSYPVLVLLDANDEPQFRAAIANVNFLASRSAILPMIIVGIPNGKDRTHDLTPPATGKTATQFATAGGADAFADFVADEVLPLVRGRYRARPATIFAGHSFGGLIALHIAATRPTAYLGIVAMSPALWWNDSTAVIQYADAIAKSPARQRIFTTSGALEQPIDIPTKRFVARLDSNTSKVVAIGYRHYADDTHGLTPAPSLMDGLRFVFEPISASKLPVSALTPSSDSAAFIRAINESAALYSRAARQFGEPETLPEDVLNTLGYAAIRDLRKPALAVTLFRRNAELYPASANVYDSLGDGLLALGDTTAAVAQFKRAVEVGTRTKHPVASVSQEKVAALEKAAAAVQAGKPKP